MKLAFVMAGPQGGQIIEMDDKDFDKALADGWIMDFAAANMGGERDPFKGFTTDHNEHAADYLSGRGLYPNREMRAGHPLSTTGDRADEIEQEHHKADREAADKPKAAAKPSKK